MDAARLWLIETLGWCGALSLLGAYTLLSLQLLDSGVVYQLMNLGGALGVGVSALSRRSYPAAFLEFAWATVALVALLRTAVG